MRQKKRKDSQKPKKKGSIIILLNQQISSIKKKYTKMLIIMIQIISEQGTDKIYILISITVITAGLYQLKVILKIIMNTMKSEGIRLKNYQYNNILA